MPVISVFPDVQRAYNRVEIDWADTPSVEYARVLRVDVETGQCVPLRPYICYDGDYLLLSCGHGIFWDTEVPLDRSVYYITEGLGAPCIPTSTLVSDTFTRTLVDAWGSTESGTLGPLPYTLTGGTVPGNYDVTAGKGTHTLDTTNVIRYSVVDIGSPDFDVYATVSTPVTATGASITTRLVGRYTDTANLYFGGLVFATTGLVTLQIARLVGGVGAVVQQFADGAYAPNQEWRIRFQGNGSSLKLKAWIASTSEPATWAIETTDTNLTTGNMVGMSSRADAGNTNGTIFIPWDDFLVINECLPCEPVAASSAVCESAPLILDIFDRTLVDGWGSASTGQAYTLDGGTVPDDYDVTVAGGGTQNMTTVNAFRHSIINAGQPDQDITATMSVPVASATGANITQWVMGRFTDTSNYYTARLFTTTAGNVVLELLRRVAGALTSLSSFQTLGTGHLANDRWNLRLYVNGDQIRAKAWKFGTAEPAAWQAVVTDATLPTGNSVALATRLEAGSLDAPMVSTFTYLRVGDPEATCTVWTTMPSNGAFRLRDPVRPCNDIYMPLCFDQANLAQINGQYCVPGSGVFFASMDSEVYSPNSLLLNATNAKYPISVTRTRRGVASTLTVVSRTFADRDAVLTLNEPGSPVLLQGPPQYGIPDRYMAVQAVSVDRGLTDHKRQPRVIQMPHVEVARPAGPTQGVCGSRVTDLCDIYATWDAMADAGLTWDDLVRGRAGAESAPEFAAYRTWDDVQAEFADWNAVNDGSRTWHDLEVGN